MAYAHQPEKTTTQVSCSSDNTVNVGRNREEIE